MQACKYQEFKRLNVQGYKVLDSTLRPKRSDLLAIRLVGRVRVAG